MDLVLCGGGKGGGGGVWEENQGNIRLGGQKNLGKEGVKSLHRVQKNCVKTDPPALQKLLQ